jgi:hypothetical protein
MNKDFPAPETPSEGESGPGDRSPLPRHADGPRAAPVERAGYLPRVYADFPCPGCLGYNLDVSDYRTDDADVATEVYCIDCGYHATGLNPWRDIETQVEYLQRRRQ